MQIQDYFYENLNVKTSQKCPDYKGVLISYAIKCLLGQLSMWIMQESLFTSINRCNCTKEIWNIQYGVKVNILHPVGSYEANTALAVITPLV